MIDIATFRSIALTFPEATEQPHFEKPSFRFGKKIFATFDLKKNQVCLKLSEIDQNIFSSFDSTVFIIVPNKWGKQGWTFVNLLNVKKNMLVDALTKSYNLVALKPITKNKTKILKKPQNEIITGKTESIEKKPASRILTVKDEVKEKRLSVKKRTTITRKQ